MRALACVALGLVPGRALAPWVAGAALAVASEPVATSSPAAASEPTASIDSVRIARAEQFVRSEMERQRIPGLAIAIIDHGRVALARGYGYANLEHAATVTPATLFQSGSVGKQFTATAIMLLAEDGSLSIDDPITRFLPEAPPEWSAIHIRHLLTHTSGIREYGDDAGFDVRRSYTDDGLVRMACAMPREFQPGERFSYSNTGYLLLGAIASRVGGRHYSEQLRDRVFKPLGMTSARLIDEAAIIPHRAAGYRILDGKLANAQWIAPEQNTTGDGSLYLSLDDMVAWAQGLRARKVLKAETWKQVYEPVVLNSGHAYPYGFGWDVYDFNGQRVLEHGGAVYGFKAQITRYLGDDLAIIVLANLEEADPERIAHRVAGIVRDDLRPPQRGPIADPDPIRQAALRTFMQRAATGDLTAADLPHVRGGFQPATSTAWRDDFKGLGELRTLELTARQMQGDDEHREYLATFAHGQRLVSHDIDSLGATVDFYIDRAD